MQFKTLSLAALLAVASAESSQSVIYEVETQTQLSTTDVTITSCKDHSCTATVESTSHTVVTTTVDGIETIFTTICPETEASLAPVSTKAPVSSEAAVASSEASASSDSDIYVDVTVTPTVDVTTGVEATVTSQSTFTSIYNSKNSSAVAGVSTYAGEAASPKVMIGAVGLAGLAAVLL